MRDATEIIDLAENEIRCFVRDTTTYITSVRGSDDVLLVYMFTFRQEQLGIVSVLRAKKDATGYHALFMDEAELLDLAGTLGNNHRHEVAQLISLLSTRKDDHKLSVPASTFMTLGRACESNWEAICATSLQNCRVSFNGFTVQPAEIAETPATSASPALQLSVVVSWEAEPPSRNRIESAARKCLPQKIRKTVFNPSIEDLWSEYFDDLATCNNAVEIGITKTRFVLQFLVTFCESVRLWMQEAACDVFGKVGLTAIGLYIVNWVRKQLLGDP